MREPDTEPDSAATRQRRYRAHRRGDHSLCRRESDCRVTPDVTPSRDPQAPPEPPRVPPVAPSGLRDRGQRLWRDTTAVLALSPPQRELLLEACRLADRLDRFDALLVGDVTEWVTVRAGADGALTLTVDKLLAESRMTAVALKTIVMELRQQTEGAGGVPAVPPTGPEPAREPGEAILDELAARRADRLADAAGR